MKRTVQVIVEVEVDDAHEYVMGVGGHGPAARMFVQDGLGQALRGEWSPSWSGVQDAVVKGVVADG
jgi:hypothetical protein